MTSSSARGVPPMELTNTSTWSPELSPRSSITGRVSRSVSWSAPSMLIRSRPGSPWMPMPISTSSSPSSKVGDPAAGTVQEVRASPIERTLALTSLARSATDWRAGPAAGWARTPHRAHVGVAVPGRVGHRLEVGALLGLGPDDLLHEHRAADPAPALGVERVLDGHVVVDDHALDLDPGVLAQVGRHLEVHDVARVVLDDVQDPGPGVDLLGGPLHLVRRRRGEHLPGTGRIQHPFAHELAVHRLVPRPAPGDDPDLALHR